MPAYRVSLSAIEQKVAELEAAGETVVQVALASGVWDQAVVVTAVRQASGLVER